MESRPPSIYCRAYFALEKHFESHSKSIIGLERLMLEASGFDFRNRYPQKILIKLAKLNNFDKDTAAKTAYNMCCDLYRTFAPLKQTTPTMALACLELSARLWGMQIENPQGEDGFDYERWSTSREEVMGECVPLSYRQVRY